MSPDFIAWVKEVFAPLGPVTVKRMFGGGGVWFDGRMFALLADERIYLKRGANNAAAIAAEGCEEFVWSNPKTGRTVGLGYFEMPAHAFDDEDALRHWAGAALQAALAGKKKPQKSGTKAVTRKVTKTL
jgi:DNA transformation protein and related proteins